ncbi:MFS transporter [Streptomyces tricolor]|nr:MFS transporter [Streptomyces tricolor]
MVGGGFALFTAARSNLAELFAAMGLLGFGVGGFSAAMPGVILAVTPKSETSSAMSFNYVVRSVGYSLGSAIGGLILAAGTGPGHLFPDDSAYTTAALVGVGAMAITTLTGLALARRRSSKKKRDHPVSRMHSSQSQMHLSQHWRFHAQGLLGQRLPHHFGS